MSATSGQRQCDIRSACSADESGPQKAELRHIAEPRPKLFYERYGIFENPFGVAPNPRYLYGSQTHTEAKSSLIVGVKCGVGFRPPPRMVLMHKE
jgi:hypothetical protein